MNTIHTNTEPAAPLETSYSIGATYARTAKVFASVVALQIAVLAAMTIAPVATLTAGKVYTVQTVPVDPWNMFRGDYVRLGYEFNEIKLKSSASPLHTGQKVYVRLAQDHAHKWQARSITTEKPAPLAGELILAGKVDYVSEKTARVNYGIEQVFVAEGNGRAAERAASLSVAIAVDSDGHAVIKEVQHGENPIYQWKLL